MLYAPESRISPSFGGFGQPANRYRLVRATRPARLTAGSQTTCVWGAIQPIVDAGTGAAIVCALAWSALPLLTGKAAEQNRKQSTAAASDQEEGDGVKFGVMTVVGAIPLVNWSSWIFAALEDEELRQAYYLFAALYGLPMLSRGFSQDAFSIATVALCVLHVQVERLARTEALKLDVPTSVRQLAAGVQQRLQPASVRAQASPSSSEDEEDASLSEQQQKDLAQDLSKWDDRFKMDDPTEVCRDGQKL